MGLKKACEKIILIIVTLSLLLTFIVAPSSYAKLTLEDGEFYYAGTTKGTYTASEGIFSWLLDNLSQIADWLVGIMTMGPRMVFVGWTALIERILTWTLETTTGVNMNGDGVDSATDLSSITDSSSNITVQAIVYNQVPAFDINFFDFEYDPTVSGTGHTYMCDKCDKECSDADCCGTSSDACKCKCNGKCDGCQAYMAALEVGANVDKIPPVVIQLKNLVSTWYYVLRLLSLAAMLIVLIGIGIKMAISTIASEKAVYKRMLVDWVVGLIVLVSIHYIMWFIIQINDTLVGVIKDSANSINQVQLKQLYDKNDAKGEKKEISNEEIEISVYEEIRTRAYDPKLSVGLSGMIMYMTLVYFAVRYSLVYMKRFLTLVVLTLMGPPVGVAYALQKAMSGKSSTFKAWMTEYVMNVIIQSVHALIYAVFISQALVLSLQSVAGMIVALIFMNFALKAEKLFKQIFKMSSEGSLLESAEQAGDAEKIKSNFQAARGLYMGAKPVAGALMNTPLAKFAKGIGKVGAVGIGLGAKGALAAKDKFSGTQSESFERAVDREMDRHGEGSAFKRNDDGSNAETEEQYEARRAEAAERVLERKPEYRKLDSQSLDSKTSIASLMAEGEEKLRANVGVAMSELSQTKEGTPEYAKAKEKYDNAMADYGKFKSYSMPSNKDIVRGHIERATDITNHFQFVPNEENKMSTKSNFGNLLKGTFGTGHYDAKAGKWVSDKNGYYTQFGASKLLGFTDEDKKVFKENVWNPIRNGFGGMAAMFVGMGTMVAHPTMGMAMLAGGAAATRKTFRKPASAKEYKGTYGFSRFSVPAMNSIQRAAIARANREINSMNSNADAQMVQRVKNEYPNLYNSLRADLKKDVNKNRKAEEFMKDLKVARNAGVTAATLGLVTGAGICAVPAATIATSGLFAQKFVAKTGISTNIEAIQKHNANQTRKQQLGFMKDAVNLQVGIEQDAFAKELKEKEKSLSDSVIKEMADELGFKYDAKSGGIIQTQEEKKAQEEFEKTIVRLYAEQGILYDPKTGTISSQNNPSENAKKIEVSKEELSEPTQDKSHVITDTDVKTINKEIDIIVDEMIAKSDGHEIDMNSEANQNEAMKKLTDRLVTVGILTKDGKAEQIFKNGKAGLEDALKRRADFGNNKAKAADKSTDLTDKQKETVRDIIAKLSESAEKEIDAKEVLSGVKAIDGKAVDKSKDGSTSPNSKVKQPSLESVKDYINNLQRIEVTRSATQDTVRAKKSKINKKSAKKMEKLEQILQLSEGDFSTDDAIKEVSSINKNNGGQIKDTKLSGEQASDVLKLLLMRKEMETINEFAEKELEITKGTKSYKKQLKAKSDAALEYYKAKLVLERENIPYAEYSIKEIDSKLGQIKDLEVEADMTKDSRLKDLMYETIKNKKANLNNAKNQREEYEKTKEKIKKYEEIGDKEKADEERKKIPDIFKLEESVNKAKQEKEKKENLLRGKGPIIDVDQFIKENFNTKR